LGVQPRGEPGIGPAQRAQGRITDDQSVEREKAIIELAALRRSIASWMAQFETGKKTNAPLVPPKRLCCIERHGAVGGGAGAGAVQPAAPPPPPPSRLPAERGYKPTLEEASKIAPDMYAKVVRFVGLRELIRKEQQPAAKKEPPGRLPAWPARGCLCAALILPGRLSACHSALRWRGLDNPIQRLVGV
jgi:hypothetical protein